MSIAARLLDEDGAPISDGNPLSVDANYLLSISMGIVPGKTSIGLLSRNPDVGIGAFEDIWDVGGTLIYATAGETLEIVSSSADDSSSGSGARTVSVLYLDDQYNSQNTTLTLNGTTPVEFTPTDSFRFIVAIVVTTGSGKKNAGTITIRV